MSCQIEPIGYVHATRAEAVDDFWGGSQSVITLADDFGPEALQGLEEFSHVEISFLLDRVPP
jgi:tRNA (adenine37-N6)-methyltransferase